MILTTKANDTNVKPTTEKNSHKLTKTSIYLRFIHSFIEITPDIMEHPEPQDMRTTPRLARTRRENMTQ